MIQKNQSPQILLTAFRGTSAEWLINGAVNYRTLLLPNDKIIDSEKLIEAILNEETDYIISFGQRPNMKDKVHIETTAKDGEFLINTNIDFEKLKTVFEQNDVISKISHNAGTSFCNQLYLNVLKYIYTNNMDTKMVFIHIPFKKNISDFESFCTKIFDAIADIQTHI